jgi:hypothetical protein
MKMGEDNIQRFSQIEDSANVIDKVVCYLTNLGLLNVIR